MGNHAEIESSASGKLNPTDQHSFRWDSLARCKICSKCGTAEHTKAYKGFKYWYAGDGYHELPPCR